MRFSRVVSAVLLGVASSLLSAAASSSSSASASSNGAGAHAQCVSSIEDPTAPVLGPLVSVFGESLVRTVFGFITDTPFGKVLAGKEAYTCIANMNGTMLGETIKDRLQNKYCAVFYNITDVPFVRDALGMLTNKTVGASLVDTLKFIKSIPNDQMDTFCNMYTQSLVPCISSELLPALAVVRAKYSNDCCDGWVNAVLDDYGYSISGQITKMAQLFGDVMCSTQTPGFSGTGSQRCGYTLLQTLITKPDEASMAASVLRNLQVPTDQMCLRAEGEAYTDINGKKIEPKASEPTPSGCVVAVDRAASWIYGLPFTQRSEKFDVKSLFDSSLQGSELFPTLTNLIPQLAFDELQTYFSRSRVHVPMKFADGCTYSRPATLVQWANEPSPVQTSVSSTPAQENGNLSDSTSTPTTPTPSTTTSSAQKSAIGFAVFAIGTLMQLM